MNKAELVEAVATKAKTSKSDAEKVIDASIEVIIANLKKGGDVRVTGFGSLVVKKRKARKGTNPATGKTITIPASKTVGFKVSKALKAKL